MKALFQLLRGEVPSKEPEWPELLAFADRTQLTLYLRHLDLPIRAAIEERYEKNQSRRARLKVAYLELQSELPQHTVLKGFTHEPLFGTQGQRVQHDLDILVEDQAAAEAALRKLGYAPHGEQALSDEHSRPWVRPFQYDWRGDYFDPAMPVSIELHTELWSSKRDRIACPPLTGRTILEHDGMSIPALAEPDRITFAALHALRHILRNDARPAHVYELSRVAPISGELELIVFRFAHEWFGTPAPKKLSDQVEEWFRDHAWSPIENLTTPNKNAVWLHVALLDNWQDRASVLRTRLLPTSLPHDPFAHRLRYHASALLPALKAGIRSRWRRTASSSASHTPD
jgi:Uncharacterised nucleotidyltransferase